MSQIQIRESYDRGQLINWLIFILLSVVWGSSFILIKKGLVAYSPVQLALMRVSISALAFLPIFFTRTYRLPAKSLKYAAAVGVFGSGIPALLYAIAETGLESAIAGILNAMTPIFTLLFGIWLFRVKSIAGQIAAVGIGFLGALLLVINPQSGAGVSINAYAFLVILATASYGISGNIVKRYCQDMHPLALTAVSFFSLGWITIPGLLLGTDFFEVLENHPQSFMSFGAIAVLSLVGTVLANILFFRLIQRTDAVFASAVSYCIPITAIFWGLLDGEQLFWFQFIGMGLILFGIYRLSVVRRIAARPGQSKVE